MQVPEEDQSEKTKDQPSNQKVAPAEDLEVEMGEGHEKNQDAAEGKQDGAEERKAGEGMILAYYGFSSFCMTGAQVRSLGIC